MEVWCQNCGSLLLKLDDGLEQEAYTLVVCSSCQKSSLPDFTIVGLLG